MTALLRGELIKVVTTRTLLGYAALGVAVAIANVLIITLSQDLTTAADKQEAIAGLPMLLILFGLVGAAGEYRHRTAAPAALAAAVQRAGGRVEFLEGAAGLAIEGLDAAQVGELAHDERVVLHELAARAGSLEDVFFNLTEEEAA